MFTSTQIRQSFLDFFKSKQHTIVSSSSLLPDSPNLLFTNAGMNQFVPIFLAQQPCPYSPGRAADTQKCIRAGGKHNDLEDVGIDTYHHTFFEMLGNWSFGDYFKKEAIEWAWELVVDVWKFPKERLYATVYKPGAGDPSEWDKEAHAFWTAIFEKAGLDPGKHIVFGGKKDNFWMMGETGPCGPCSELHVDLTPKGNTEGRLVNAGSPECIEIWNLVFIQFNANQDGTFVPLPAKHVDTGMGFERVTSILQGTKEFRDFSGVISNYETDIFRPIFERLEKMSGKKYHSTLPTSANTEQEKIDIAFRVIADHIRTLSFAIADGIQPSNEGRGYVLRRILRRAVRFGRTLGFKDPFFHELTDVVADNFGAVFPEVLQRKDRVKQTLLSEEKSFNETLDRGIEIFQQEIAGLKGGKSFPADMAFKLYDTYGFPLDLTQLMARELGLSVDEVAFEKRMEEQRARARSAQKKEIIEVSTDRGNAQPTAFVGFEKDAIETKVLDVIDVKGKAAVILEITPFYAEMGGQVGDRGKLKSSSGEWKVVDTQKKDGVFFHLVGSGESPSKGGSIMAELDREWRKAVERHHSVTHLFHWALHEVVDRESRQKGSFVGPEYLRFDFNLNQGVTPAQLADIEKLVNERIKAGDAVNWFEKAYAEVQGDPSIQQFFGDKYGDTVRVVQIGDYSRELCGGTHVRNTSEIGIFKIKKEAAIAAGIRRIEAVAGPAAIAWLEAAEEARKADEAKAQQKALEQEAAKQKKAQLQKQAQESAGQLLSKVKTVKDVPVLIENLGEVEGDYLQCLSDVIKLGFKGVMVLAGSQSGQVSLLAIVSPEYTSRIQAGKIIQTMAPIVGGKGGGRPDFARGAGKDPAKMGEALSSITSLF